MGTMRAGLLLLLLVTGIAASTTVSGFTARYMDITVERGGNATVTFEFASSWIEGVLAFVGAVRPDRDLQSIFAATTGSEVRTLSVGDGITLFSVEDFAGVRDCSPGVAYETEALDLSWGDKGYRSSLLAPILSPDFSPQVTVIRFPDGYTVSYHDELLIPGINRSCTG